MRIIATDVFFLRMTTCLYFLLSVSLGAVLGRTPVLPPFPRRLHKDGDFMIGAILPVTKDGEGCDESMKPRALVEQVILWTEAIKFTIQAINDNQSLLGNLTLGYDIRDSCYSNQVAMRHALDFIDVIATHSADDTVDCSDNKDVIVETSRETVSASSNLVDDLGEDILIPTLSPRARKAPSEEFIFEAEFPAMITSASKLHNGSGVASSSEKPVVALLGCVNSDLTTGVAGLAQVMTLPLVGFMSTAVSLTDPSRYPTFLRTVLEDNSQAQMLTDILVKYDWSYISVIGTTNEYGRQGVESLMYYMEGRNICVALQEYFDPASETMTQDLGRIVKAIAEKGQVTVVVLFMNWAHVNLVLQEAERQHLTGMIWMATESWGGHPGALTFNRSLVEGAIGLSLPRHVLSRFHEHLSNTDFICSPDHPWLYHLLCSRGICDPVVVEYHLECCSRYYRETGKMACPLPAPLDVFDVLNDIVEFTDSDAIFDAVLTVAYGLDALLKNASSSSLNDASKFPFNHATLLHYMRNAEFSSFFGKKVHFRSTGDIAECSYDVVSLQFDECEGSLVWKTVGQATSQNGRAVLSIEDDQVRFANGATRVTSRCSAACGPGSKMLPSPEECCWECQLCLEGSVSNVSMGRECTACNIIEHTDANKTRCIPDSLKWLYITDPVGILILVASVLGQIITLIVISILGRHKNNPVCSALAFKTTSLLVCYAGFLQPVIYTVQPSAMLCTFAKITWFSVYIVHGATLVARTYKVKFLVDKLKRQLGYRLHNVHHAVMWSFALVGFVLLGVSFLDNVPTVTYIKESLDVTFAVCVETMEAADVTIIAYALLLLVITGLLAETSKHSRSLDDKFLSYTSGAMLLMLVVFLPVYYTIDQGIGKVIILSVSVVITQYAVLCLTYFTKIYYMFRSYHKKETVRSALALERKNMASLNEGSSQTAEGSSQTASGASVSVSDTVR